MAVVHRQLNGGWRDTYYTRSLSARAIPTGRRPTTNLNRRFFTLQAQMLGPVFNRIWDTPENGYAEKFKHTVEPYMNVQRTSSIDNYDQIIQLDGTDTSSAARTQYSYGVNNRFYAKRPATRGGRARRARFSTSRCRRPTTPTRCASQYDPRYRSSTASAAPSNFSPILLERPGHAEQRSQRAR